MIGSKAAGGLGLKKVKFVIDALSEGESITNIYKGVIILGFPYQFAVGPGCQEYHSHWRRTVTLV